MSEAATEEEEDCFDDTNLLHIYTYIHTLETYEKHNHLYSNEFLFLFLIKITYNSSIIFFLLFFVFFFASLGKFWMISGAHTNTHPIRSYKLNAFKMESRQSMTKWIYMLREQCLPYVYIRPEWSNKCSICNCIECIWLNVYMVSFFDFSSFNVFLLTWSQDVSRRRKELLECFSIGIDIDKVRL